MKKLLLLFFALTSSVLSYAMNDRSIPNLETLLKLLANGEPIITSFPTEQGNILQIAAPSFNITAYECIEQRTKNITRVMCCNNAHYIGTIKCDTPAQKHMLDQAEIKATFEELETQFNAAQNKK